MSEEAMDEDTQLLFLARAGGRLVDRDWAALRSSVWYVGTLNNQLQGAWRCDIHKRAIECRFELREVGAQCFHLPICWFPRRR